MTKTPENVKRCVWIVIKAKAIKSFAKRETTPAEFLKDFLKEDWLYHTKNVNANEITRTLVFDHAKIGWL